MFSSSLMGSDSDSALLVDVDVDVDVPAPSLSTPPPPPPSSLLPTPLSSVIVDVVVSGILQRL